MPDTSVYHRRRRAGGQLHRPLGRFALSTAGQRDERNLESSVYALAVYNAELIAGDWFTITGDYVSGYWGL